MRLSWSSLSFRQKNHRQLPTNSASEPYLSTPLMATSYRQGTRLNTREIAREIQAPRTQSSVVLSKSPMSTRALRNASMRSFRSTQRCMRPWSHATRDLAATWHARPGSWDLRARSKLSTWESKSQGRLSDTITGRKHWRQTVSRSFSLLNIGVTRSQRCQWLDTEDWDWVAKKKNEIVGVLYPGNPSRHVAPRLLRLIVLEGRNWARCPSRAHTRTFSCTPLRTVLFMFSLSFG